MPPTPVFSAECRQDMEAPPTFRLPSTVDPRNAVQVAEVAIGFADTTNTWARAVRERVNGCAAETRDNAARHASWLERQSESAGD